MPPSFATPQSEQAHGVDPLHLDTEQIEALAIPEVIPGGARPRR
ncbi:hypothetical protein TVNIR_1722 [Thioalkalivibrio nitratireducens DSM 14787]|uniref:Uncharacterized protein n=1 Tax=Thioalkalivibrio nitratireducens (strain DSM 14787 / UNIQEM 213 / ALEN2) TaxID=1255043 RepID=L0DUY0_THIND|nr:hypothetical protein [Thioalkalivibrio nitratireducens]AGA33384.1 hypothetical protein TVNIR_1722 [Thioalkalivibrio nitratireducens DSM 14787]